MQYIFTHVWCESSLTPAIAITLSSPKIVILMICLFFLSYMSDTDYYFINSLCDE